MNQPAVAFQTYLTHANTARISIPHKYSEFNVMEIGPGDSVFTAVIAKALDANNTWLVDAGHYATTCPKDYQSMVDFLKAQGYELKINTNSFDSVLSSCNAHYLTDGVASLSKINDLSIDFIFSNAVLENIPKNDFYILVREMKRVLKSSGVCVHRVDLKDHLGGGLNNLRFSEKIWESDLFRKSGFYTNRLRYSEIFQLFDQVGFAYEVTRKVCWSNLPIDRSLLASRFQKFTEDDLCISGFDVLLRHKEI